MCKAKVIELSIKSISWQENVVFSKCSWENKKILSHFLFYFILYQLQYVTYRIFFFLFILNFGYIIKKIKGIYIPQVLINRISISGTHKMWEKILLRFYKCIQTLHSPMHVQIFFFKKTSFEIEEGR